MVHNSKESNEKSVEIASQKPKSVTKGGWLRLSAYYPWIIAKSQNFHGILLSGGLLMVLAARSLLCSEHFKYITQTKYCFSSNSRLYWLTCGTKSTTICGYFSSADIECLLEFGLGRFVSTSLWIKEGYKIEFNVCSWYAHFSIFHVNNVVLRKEPSDALSNIYIYCTQIHLSYWIWMVAVFFSLFLFGWCVMVVIFFARLSDVARFAFICIIM